MAWRGQIVAGPAHLLITMISTIIFLFVLSGCVRIVLNKSKRSEINEQTGDEAFPIEDAGVDSAKNVDQLITILSKDSEALPPVSKEDMFIPDVINNLQDMLIPDITNLDIGIINSNDSSSICGNGIKEQNELCDTAIAAGQPGACPTTCNDNQSCTADTLSSANCTAHCVFTTITSCIWPIKDGCCPSGCTVTTDEDCKPTFLVYKFDNVTGAPAVGEDYHDEAHNINTTGNKADTSGHNHYATGQLLDGLTGTSNWQANLGNGRAYEWIGWDNFGTITLDFQFPAARSFSSITIGYAIDSVSSITQPDQIAVSFSSEGTVYSTPINYIKGIDYKAKTQKSRYEVILTLPTAATGNFVKIAITYPSWWLFLDEISFQ